MAQPRLLPWARIFENARTTFAKKLNYAKIHLFCFVWFSPLFCGLYPLPLVVRTLPYLDCL